MEITSTPKRLRALPRVWQRFLYLEIGDGFFIGRCAYVKTGLLRGSTGSRVIRVWPWTRVQTAVLVRDARPGGKSSVIHDCALRVPADVNDGKTHFVGDDCKGGHADVSQPHSDNGISGPTS